jgi:HPt (histidine-containing phosphotransfer) domain-containing protein
MDESVLAGLIRPFLADAERLSDEIRGAIARQDGGTVARAAHQLRGSAGWFQLAGLTELARRLEELGKAGDFTAHLERVYQELVDDLARLAREL